MWRLWVLVLVTPVVGEEEFLDGEDVGYLERRLDDGRGLGELAIRSRVKGAEGEWGRLQLYQRVEWKPREGQLLFALAERDPGETNWRDFSSFYYQVSGKRGELVVGDLRPAFAAGVIMGRSRRGGMTASVSADDGARLGYRSSGENEALRGAVFRSGWENWQGVLFVGKAMRDGRINEDGHVSSLPTGGYHVTTTEVAGQDLLSVRTGGGRLRWRGEHWQWGVTALGLNFSHPLDLRRTGRTPWGFVGSRQRLGGVDMRFGWGRSRMALEVAGDGVGHWGAVGALGIRVLDRRLRLLARYYAPGFHSFFGGAPGAPGMQNELGGIAVLSGRGWRLYAEAYRRPQRSYFVPVAATYATWGAQWARQLGDLSVRGQWQGRWRPRWRDGQLDAERQHKWRLDIDHAAWRWRTEAQRLLVDGRIEWGLLGSTRFKTRWLALHLSRFQTASYATRVYEFEVDLPGSVSIRPLYGSGWRAYALVSAAVGRWSVSARYRLQWDRRLRRYSGLQVDWLGGDVDKR